MDIKKKFLLSGLLCIFCISFGVVSSHARTIKGLEGQYGKVSGQMRSFYFFQGIKTDGSVSKSKESLALGGQFKYETPWLAEHFRATVNAFWATPLLSEFAHSRYGNTGVLSKGNQGYAVLGEAYLAFKHEGTEAKLGRQRIETPYLNGNDSRLLPNSFEAFVVESKVSDDLSLNFAWVDKIKLRDSNHFVSMTEAAGAKGKNGGLLLVGLDWVPITNLHVKGWNYYAPDLDNTLFVEMGYSQMLTDNVEGHVRVQAVDQRNVGSSYLGNYQGNEVGLLAGVRYNGWTFDAGATLTTNEDGIKTPWGVNPFFNMMMINSFNRAGEKVLFLSTTYDFSKVGLDGFTTNVKAGFGVTPDSGKNASADRNEYDLNFMYKFNGSLEGFSILNRWAYLDADESEGGTDGMQVRLRLQYDF